VDTNVEEGRRSRKVFRQGCDDYDTIQGGRRRERREKREKSE
jgi:hypothetical protein